MRSAVYIQYMSTAVAMPTKSHAKLVGLASYEAGLRRVFFGWQGILREHEGVYEGVNDRSK